MVIKVSVYEDNVALLESLSYLIREAEGLELCTASSTALQIVDECRNNCPDVIMMDIDMPQITGIEATRLVKKDFPDINVMILTVFEDKDKIFEALCAGATGYLLKKTPSVQIINAIRDIFHGGSPISIGIARKVLEFFSKPVSSEKNECEERSTASKLTQRETEILKYLVKGYSYKKIADACCISINTVNNHINNLYKKLHINSKSEAVVKVLQKKIEP